MFNLFIQTFKLNNSIFSNTFIYRIRSLPLIKKIISNRLYGNEGISAFLSILLLIINIFRTLGSRLIYILSISFFATQILNENPNINFIIIFIMLSIYGAFFNNKILIATKEKYYAVVLMRIDGNQYAKMTYVYEMIFLFITSLISLIASALIFNINFTVILLAILFVVPCKSIGLFFSIQIYRHHKANIIEKPLFNMIFSVIVLLLIIGLVLINISTYFVFIAFILVSILFSIYCVIYIMKTNHFKIIYKDRLTLNNVIFNYSQTISAQTKKTLNKQIKLDKDYHSNKKGYDLLNDIFVKRHKAILTNLVNKFAIAYAVSIIIAIITIFIYPPIKVSLGNVILFHLAPISFLMYFTNRGATITRAMFVNCDSSMLNFRFYRRPKDILTLFTLRLKSVVTLNLRADFILTIGILIVLFLSGVSYNPIHYISIFVLIIALSIFFSVHNLVLYYLLQPYNINMQAKGFLYSFISSLTYILCYTTMQMTVDTTIFSIIVSIFCIIYVIIALRLSYKYAYKTFKIKQ